MSLAADRQEIADALTTVQGVTGYAERPDVIDTGAAWPVLESMDRGPGQAFECTWRVVVILGGVEAEALELIDQTMPALVQALSPVAFVDSARPTAYATEAGDLFGLEITARSE